MSEQASNNTQQTLVIGLAIVAVLLAAVVGIVVWMQSSAVPAPTAVSQGATAETNDAATPAGMGQSAAAEFDPATATKVAAGTEPEAWVAAYYEACDKDDWEGAFDHLPTAKQAGNSPEALEQQVSGYGIKGFKVVSAKVDGDKAVVIVDQETGEYGTFENTWTFVKVGSDWLVENKAVTGMK